jgi:hypothetical protein
MPAVTHYDDSSVLGGRVPKPVEKKQEREEGPPDAFSLFCAYHLGITASDGYQKPHADEVARRFGLSVDALKSLLAELEIDDASIKKSRFDLTGAQMDIRLAPQGISRTEAAREHFQELLEAMGRAEDD